MINWTQSVNGINNFPTGVMPGDDNYYSWWTVQGNIGNSHMTFYALFYLVGIIAAVAYCAWKFYKKDIPLTQLAIGVIIIIPCSLFGGSFFGKLNADGIGENAGGVGFWGLFAFWHAGMAIHGGVYVGVLVGVITFGIIGHHTHTSLWTYMDAIIPNILLGQGFGRWGNFMNHEVMGAPVGLVGMYNTGTGTATFTNQWGFLHSLPHYIRANTQVVYTGGNDVYINGMHMVPGGIYQMAPLFFYESVAFFVAWFLITFLIPNIGKMFGPKPWKRHKDLFKFSWKWTLINIFAFWKVPTHGKIEKMTEEFYKNGQKPSYKEQPEWAQSWFVIWEQSYEYNPNYNERQEYEQAINDAQYSNENLTKKRYHMGRALRKANNPDGYWTTKVGCEASAYFFVWNITRFSMELQRPYDHLFIMFNKPLSLAIIMITAVLGIVGMVLTQTIAATFFRQPDYLYEKQYFKDKLIQKHWWTTSKKLATENMSNEEFRPTPVKVKRAASHVAREERIEDERILDKQRKAQEKLARMEAKNQAKASKSKPKVPKVDDKTLAKQRKAEAKLAKMQEKQNKNK